MHQQNRHLEVWTIRHGSIHVDSESEDYYWPQIHVSGTQNLETNPEAYIKISLNFGATMLRSNLP